MRWGIVKLLGVLTILSATFSWIGFLWPPISNAKPVSGPATRADDGPSVAAFFEALLSPYNRFYEDAPYGGWLWLAVSICVALIAILSLLLVAQWIIRYFENARAAISVLETKIGLTFEDEALEKSCLDRNQLIHANRRVTAYRMISSVSAQEAIIDKDSLEILSETDEDGPLKTRVLNVGTDKSREIIEIYDEPLPVSWFATYLPNWFVYRFRTSFGKVIVRRTSRIKQTKEYCIAAPLLQLTALSHPTNNPMIEIDFPASTAPERDDVEAFMIAQNWAEPVTVREVVPRPLGRRVYFVKAKAVPPGSVLRVSWSNKKLEAWKRLASEGQ